MLTGYQCETVAFYLRDSGEYICRDCAVAATSTVTVDKCERGLENAYGLSAVIRYSMDESNGERTWEAAEERARDFENDHPVLAELLGVQEVRDRPFQTFGFVPTYSRREYRKGITRASHDPNQGLGIGLVRRGIPEGPNRWRLLDRVAEKLGDAYAETCGDCGAELD